MNPGDLIEWTYTHNNQLVIERETLWSTLMKRWVPIGSGLIHTLISIDDERITWMNEKGLFHARVGDSVQRPSVVDCSTLFHARVGDRETTSLARGRLNVVSRACG